MVILSKLRVGQYGDDDHPQDALHFTLLYWTSFTQVLSSEVLIAIFLNVILKLSLSLVEKMMFKFDQSNNLISLT